MYKVPEDLINMPEKHQYIELDGCMIIESCQHEGLVADSMYVNKRFLLCVLFGKTEFQVGSETITIEEGQIGLINQNLYAPHRKHGPSKEGYASVLFFLDDDFVQQFAERRSLTRTKDEKGAPIFVTDPTLQILDFIKSVLNLFYSELKYDKELLLIKVKELLIYLTSQHPEMIHQLLENTRTSKKDLAEVMENNYLKYASLEEFAFMSGRSITTFKRDFKELFNETPAKWLKTRRMQHAQYLLKHAGVNVSEVYNKVGFINYSHFSRAFKEHFGYGPSSIKGA